MSSIPVGVVPDVDEPTDLLGAPVQALETPQPTETPSLVSRVIYVALAVFPLLLVILVVLARAGIISTSQRQSEAPWDLGVMVVSTAVVVSVAALVAKRAPDLLRRARNVTALDHEKSKWELRVLTASLPPATALLVLAFMGWQGIVTSLGPLTFDTMTPPLLTTLAVFITTAPVGYFAYARERHISQLEQRFPDFLRDLNESYGAGLTMAQAIRVAARGDYGRLNPEIRRMAHQVSWGTPFTDALKMFSDRVETPIVTRAVALIIKATKAGGNAKDVLAAAARDAREIKALQQERKLSMTLYVIVIYVAFSVFLGVVAALQGLLVPALLQSTQAVAGGSLAGLSVSNSLDFMDFRLIYFGVGLVQALGSGIVAGVMAEASFAAGLKHATILMALSILVLGFLL